MDESQEMPDGGILEAGTGLIGKVSDFYHKAMYRTGGGLRFLRKLGLDDSHLIDSHRLGYCDGSLAKLVTDEKMRVALSHMGLLCAGDGGMVETFKGCVVIPVNDADGGLVALSGIDGRTRKLHMQAGCGISLWNMQAAANYPDILLAEGIMEALSLIEAGYPNTVGIAGQDVSVRDVENLLGLGVGRVTLLASPGRYVRLTELFRDIECVRPAMRVRLDVNGILARKGARELAGRIDELLAGAEVIRPAGMAREKRAGVDGNGLTLLFGTRKYVVRGIEKTQRSLKATVRAEHRGRLHVDTVDLYNARMRKNLAQDLTRLFEESAEAMESDLCRLIRHVEAFDPEKGHERQGEVLLSDEERRHAEEFGKAPDIMERIIADYERCGLVGEKYNKLLCYIAAVSRKLADPLSILVLSSSGAGKTALQDATLALCPPEDVVKVTSLTGKALFYKGRKSLQHKILAIEEGAGAEDATYAIRNLVSAKELVIEATVKDFATGRMTTMENRVEGPTAVFFTTTDPEPDPETRSRFFVLTVDESREQTRAILAYQRRRHMPENMAGRNESEAIMKLHRNFQRLLKPMSVANPHAGRLAYADDRLQSRRDHPKYLNLINAVAFLRQMGKPVLTAKAGGKGIEYIEVDEKDLAIAGEVFEQVVQRGLDDLNGVSRALLMQIEAMVAGRIAELRNRQERNIPHRQDIVFSRREIREYTGWSHMRVVRYLRQLLDTEFLVMDSGRIGFAYRYRLGGMPCDVGEIGVRGGDQG